MVRRGVKLNPNKGAKQNRKITYKFFVDCNVPIEDGVLDLDDFEQYVANKYKIEGKSGYKGKKLNTFKAENKLFIHTTEPSSRRYIKYLTKKYLKKENLRDFLKVTAEIGKDADSKKSRGYRLSYFTVPGAEEGADAE